MTDRAFFLDLGVIAIGSVWVCLAAQKLLWMTVVMVVLWSGRLFVYSRLGKEQPHAMAIEWVLCVLCTLIGGFNDWNSVVHHRIYDYNVPVYFPDWSTIPIWMLLFWGLILRFLISLFRWKRLAPSNYLREEIHLGRLIVRLPWLRVGLLLLLVFVTRQSIYRAFLDPVWSWLPFALALGAYLFFFRISVHERWLVGLFLLGGPGVEILFIQVGGLHRYALGWLGGVPLWIALWWVLAMLIWNDISSRLLLWLGASAESPST